MKDKRVKIKDSWGGAPQAGVALGDAINIYGMMWVPVLWDGEVDPDWHKLAGLDFV